MAAFNSRGGASWLNSTPSTRKRTRNSFSNGSMWMSLARFSTASRDHGVHQADDGRFARHVAQMFEVGRGLLVVAGSQRVAARSPRSVSRWHRESPASAASTVRTCKPEKARMAATVSKSRGSAIATVRTESATNTGNARHWRRKRCESPSISGAPGGGPSTVTNGSPSWSESAASTSRCAITPMSTRILPSLSPRSFCSSRARSRLLRLQSSGAQSGSRPDA